METDTSQQAPFYLSTQDPVDILYRTHAISF